MADSDAPWHNCDSPDAFAPFLEQVAADLTGTQRRYADRALNDFFWSWSRAVGAGWPRGAASLAAAEDEPGWRCLAFQIHDALTGRPGYNCVWADWGTDWQEVHKRYHLAGYLGGLATAVHREQHAPTDEAGPGSPTDNAAGWTHLTLSGYLAAWAAWLKDADAASTARMEPVTWHSIALQLHSARTYSPGLEPPRHAKSCH